MLKPFCDPKVLLVFNGGINFVGIQPITSASSSLAYRFLFIILRKKFNKYLTFLK